MDSYHKEPSLNFFVFFSLLTQVFLRDSQHALLQSRLHLEQIHKICVLQRWVKGALQRKQFIRQKNAAVMIQVRTENGGLPLSAMDLWTFGSECKESQTPLLPSPPLKKKMRARHSHWTHLRVPFLIEGRCLEIFSRNFLKIFYGNCKTSLKQS